MILHDGFVSREVLLTGTGKHHVACVEPRPSHTTFWSSHNKNARVAINTDKLFNSRCSAPVPLHRGIPHPSEVNARQAATSNGVQRGRYTAP